MTILSPHHVISAELAALIEKQQLDCEYRAVPTERLVALLDEFIAARYGAWHDVKTTTPPLRKFVSGQGWSEKQYVLAVDANGRMSIGFATAHSQVPFMWTFAKPIGEPTHWMYLPALP